MSVAPVWSPTARLERCAVTSSPTMLMTPITDLMCGGRKLLPACRHVVVRMSGQAMVGSTRTHLRQSAWPRRRRGWMPVYAVISVRFRPVAVVTVLFAAALRVEAVRNLEGRGGKQLAAVGRARRTDRMKDRLAGTERTGATPAAGREHGCGVCFFLFLMPAVPKVRCPPPSLA